MRCTIFGSKDYLYKINVRTNKKSNIVIGNMLGKIKCEEGRKANGSFHTSYRSLMIIPYRYRGTWTQKDQASTRSWIPQINSTLTKRRAWSLGSDWQRWNKNNIRRMHDYAGKTSLLLRHKMMISAYVYRVSSEETGDYIQRNPSTHLPGIMIEYSSTGLLCMEPHKKHIIVSHENQLLFDC